MLLTAMIIAAPMMGMISAVFPDGAAENGANSGDLNAFAVGDGIMVLEDSLTNIELMSLTRTEAVAAEPGNLFSADSGIYADVSDLTAWSNNVQKVIGGTGRTPIVFNNAQTTGGWRPVSVAGLDNADAFQIKFSTLGYENIRFSCTQKSTGSGPDAFLLAYSIGDPEGPYTVVSDSGTGTNGIPAITRMSNDTYAALQASYSDFVLPSEMEDETEVYLRIVFSGSASLGQNGNTSVNDIVLIGDALLPADVELMSLTRTTAADAESGNMFSADSGVYAGVSDLTAWNNNEQITIGGTGRTPMVINNAAVNNNPAGGSGWRSVGPSEIDEGITADTATAFQIKFETTGYENIRFSASQKSTGSGPEHFALAYSIGDPEGPYTIIENSKRSVFRGGNNLYTDLVQSYIEFELPAELADRSEVYLRVYMVDSALSNRANGNTSINNLIIIGDRIGSGGTVVNKAALTALMAEASGKAESDHTAGSWAAFAAAYQNAEDILADENATQSQVNTARSALQTAMDKLILLSDVIDTIDWPGSRDVWFWDTTPTFLEDASGLDFCNGRLYAVDNGTGRFWILDVAADGSLTFAEGFENGKRVRFQHDAGNQSAKGPDAEGITVDGDGFVYIASERDNSNNTVNWNVILKVDPWAAGSDLVAIQQWDLTSSLPAVPTNMGIEAVEWVSNADVSGKLFDKNTGAPFDISNYPKAIADGVFFVALEYNGHVYAYVLNDDGTYVMIADIDSKIGGAMALDYDVYEQVLWVVADNGYGNLAAKITFTGGSAAGIVHVNPPGGLDVSRNYEGFAIADASYTIDGQRPVYRFEDGRRPGALTIGSIDCDYQAVTYGISLSQTGNRNFGSATLGYGAQAPHTVTVSSTGTGAVSLTVAVTGANASSFSLGKTSMNIAAGVNDSFTVTPKTGLAVGTYTATVTVSGGNVDTETFTVSFTVVNAVSTEVPQTSDGDGDSGDNTMLYVAVAVAAVAGIIGAAWFLFTRVI